ncbi:MAG: DUF1499 domain-containing protein [Gammaproteobacteria bacterium]|nr:MAG: DUF1499 domain-containing protein [Gammaproteobacteria bacterium]
MTTKKTTGEQQIMTTTDAARRPLGTRWCKTAIGLAWIAGVGTLIGLAGGATGLLGPMLALGTFGLGGPLFAIAILTSLIGLALSKGTAGNASTARTWAALAIGIIVISVSVAQFPGFGAPPIHDISTDVENPPLFVAIVPLRGADSNPAEYLDDGTAGQQLKAYPDIVTLHLDRPAAEVFAAAEGIVTELGWALVAADLEAGLIEATASTYWFGFKDDVVIRVQREADTTLVDVRSKSRIGRGDMGANAARVRTFLQALRSPDG